jgi:sulfate permease, SulP family
VLKIRGNIYYGSLPVIESTYHRAIAQGQDVIIDFSECYYIDQEGIRWLAAVKAGQKTAFVDRRTGEQRRAAERDGTPSRRSDETRRETQRRRKSDRRHRSAI